MLSSQTSRQIKSTPLNATKSKQLATSSTLLRTQNTTQKSSAAVHAGDRRTRIKYNETDDVTPKPLVPARPHKDNWRPEGVDDSTSLGKAANASRDETAATASQPFPTHEKGRPIKSVLSEDELEQMVDVTLSETETETLLHFPSLCDNVHSTTVSARNKAYEELVNSKADSDQYREQHAQTLNQPDKSKEVLAAPPSQASVECNANGWDIYDTFAKEPVAKHVEIQKACEKEAALVGSQLIKKPGCLFNMNELISQEPIIKEPKKVNREDGSGSKFRGFSNKVSSIRGVASTPSRSLAVGKVSENRVSDSLGAPMISVEEHDVSPRMGTEKDMEEETAQAAGDPMPWLVGAGCPIPDTLAPQLRIMERIVSQNVFHKQHMIYRNYPTLEELAKLDDEVRQQHGKVPFNSDFARTSERKSGSESMLGAVVEDTVGFGDTCIDESTHSESDKPSLQDLFCFEAPQLTQGMTVTCAEWNRFNQDLLAVSYGDTSPVPNVSGGLVLFWSLKNPTYPEHVIRTKSGVTSLSFSSHSPNLVAAGTHDGSVSIWDLRHRSDQPDLKSGSSVSTNNDQKHTDIVWETRWVDRGPDKQPPEYLVSVSSDGNVFQWSMKKGLEQTSLMELKRLPNPFLGSNSVYGHKEGIVFRKSSGMCIDFPKHDPSTYLVGTEDGIVHWCSTSNREQYSDSFFGHSGPVYKVRSNPFMSQVFLTCSADWTMKLWSTKQIAGHPSDTFLLNFMSPELSDAVNDVVWAPHNSTSFAAAMDDGRIELWDLSEKPLDPIVVHYPRKLQYQRRRTCVRFSINNSPVLIAGDDQGSVDVMRMYNTNFTHYSDQEQQERLSAVMTKKR